MCGSNVSVRLVEIDLQQFAGIDLVNLAIAVLITNRQLANSFGFVELLDDLGNEQVELDLLAHIARSLRPCRRDNRACRLIGQILIDGEVVFLLEQLHLGLESLILADQESLEHLLRRSRYSPRESGRRGSWLLFLEFLDIRLQKVVLARVEILEEIVAPLDGDFIVDHRTSHMTALEQIDHDPRGLLILGLRRGSLSPDDHRHQGQDRNQHQRT